MDKTATLPDDSPILDSVMADEPMVLNFWNKIFADKHERVVNSVRAAFQSNPELKIKLTQEFPGFTWPEFASTPTRGTFKDIKAALDKILSVSGIQQYPMAVDAINLYLNQYKLFLDSFHESRSQTPKQQPQKVAPNPKVKQLQGLLQVTPTGIWNKESNDAFLKWLNEKGWKNYIKNNRFTGNIDSAISAMLIEQAAPDQQPTVDLDSLTKRQTRKQKLNELIKLAGDIIQFPAQTQPMPEQQEQAELIPDISPRPAVDRFTHSYATSALWASTDDEGRPLDDKYSFDDISTKTLHKMIQDCRKFQNENEQDLEEYYEIFDPIKAGHDFFLTRNGHGAGFWDRVPGQLGDRLTAASKKYGEFNLYIGDDGEVHAA